MQRAVLLLLALPFLATARDCGDGKIRGVNIGGLFLLEPWITPRIFEDANAFLGEVDLVVDEYTFAQYMPADEAARRLDSHWDTFYSQEDLQILSDSGISHVRVPVPYWLVNVIDGEPFPPPPASDDVGQRFYLKRLLGWAQSVGLKVLIDLHGAPGSQNGFDNSGRRGDIRWYEESGDLTNVDRTVDILVSLATLIKGWIDEGSIDETTIYGIEIVNEPWGIFEFLWDELRTDFYYRADDALRGVVGSADATPIMVVAQQAFRPPSDFSNFLDAADGHPGVAVDLHEYHAFGPDYNLGLANAEGWDIHLDISCDYSVNMNEHSDTFVGEWSLAITDCQKYLDEGYATPYVPPWAEEETCNYYNSNFDTYTAEYKAFLTNYMLAQMDSYETGAGYFFWTAKTEDNCAPEWDYLFLLQQGIAPADLCSRNRYCS